MCSIISKVTDVNYMRKKLYLIISPTNNENKLSNIYDFIMMATIVISIVPLAFKETNLIFQWIDYITVGIFVSH